MTNIILKDFINENFNKSTENLFFLKVKTKSAIIDAKINNGKNEIIKFEYISESKNKYAKIINALADSILSEWEE